MRRHLEEMRQLESKAVGRQLTEEEFRQHWKGSLAYVGAEIADDWDEVFAALPAWIRRWFTRKDA